MENARGRARQARRIHSLPGVGRASAIALAQAGWSVALLARRADLLEETKALCVDPSRVLLVSGDVAREEDVKRLFQATIDAFGAPSARHPPPSAR